MAYFEVHGLERIDVKAQTITTHQNKLPFHTTPFSVFPGALPWPGHNIGRQIFLCTGWSVTNLFLVWLEPVIPYDYTAEKVIL